MRVGIDITPVIYEGTGVGTYTRELVRYLLPLDKTIHYTLFASTLRGQKKLWEFLKTLATHSNFSVKIYPFPPLITEVAWNRLHKFSVERLVGEVDVFHAWDWQQPPAKKARLITTIHDLTTLKFPQEHNPQTVRVHRRRLNWVKQEASAIIADSESTRQDVINLLGVDKHKVHTVYLAASEQFTQFRIRKSPKSFATGQAEIRNQEIQRVRQKYGIEGDFILSVGTREPRKNLARIIEAFTKLSDRSNSKISTTSNLSLVIAGRYGWGNEVTKLLSYQVIKQIKILGLVPQQDLPPLYAGAKVFVYPSLYEGFGLPVLEAMSVGTPVVTSDRGSLKEVAGDAAVVVDPENTTEIAAGIKTAIGDESRILIKKGLKQIKKFSWASTASRTLKIYCSLSR